MLKNKKRSAICCSVKGTLDQRHTEKISQFANLDQSLPIKKQKLIDLETELAQLSILNPIKYTVKDIRQKAYLTEAIHKLRKETESIENNTESLNYIVKTLPILVDYYDNKDLIDDGSTETISEPMIGGKKNILSYFTYETPKNGNTLTTNNPKISKAKLYDKYLNATDLSYHPQQNVSRICDKNGCDGEKIVSANEGCLVCKKCGLSETVLLTNEKNSYKEQSPDLCVYAYKRINHLTEILSQLQAKESTDIPPVIFESILRELKKRKIDKNELDIARLRRILKKLNCRKYYEHAPHILQIINGKEPPNFSRKDETRIKKMFKDIQKPFAIYCPKDRQNFLNYYYVLHKFCELLDLDEYVNYFPLLKNNAKLLQHDKVWKNICKYMKWEYIKSI